MGNNKKVGIGKMADLAKLKEGIMKGKRDIVTEVVKAAIAAKEDINPLLDQAMIPAMREMGERFSRNEAYVPELLIAARAMQAGLSLLEPLLAASGREPLGKIAIGTVKGDLHDIGKNLVAIMFKGAGYEVIDLGVNCDVAKYQSAVDKGVQVIACSALLTTTMPYMQELVNSFKGKVKVIIGGAPVTQAYADQIGADGYSEDASQAVKLVDKLLAKTA
jgi:5-methyltetrahydrofolate--homocysteine methyltransferase